MTTKITTLQGDSIFKTLDLNEGASVEEISASDLKNVRTSMSASSIDQREQAEKNVIQAIDKGKFWLALIAAAATIFALTRENKEDAP
jgi:hypothetical protein